MKKTLSQQAGLTLLELLASIAVLGILVAVAFPAYDGLVRNNQLTVISEKFYGDLKNAQSEALKRRTDIFVSLRSGANWCYGIDDTADCDCTQANDCQVDNQNMVVSENDFTISGDTITTLGAFPIGTGGANTVLIQFNGTRGHVNSTGTIQFSKNNNTVNVLVNRIGHASLCSDTVSGYEPC